MHRTNKEEWPQLFTSIIKPFKKVSKDTIGQWIKNVMKSSGINTSIYKPHSTHATSTSKATCSQCHVPISAINNDNNNNISQVSTVNKWDIVVATQT